MKFIRKRFIIKAFSVFAIITFINSVFYPAVSYALTSGPHQPEYTSYEDAGASDMVNLLTGDFTFNMPVLTVPVGSEGNFTVPLSYHAGIGPDQEASWIGLGWNINVGSITRNINGFPDDASGETQTVVVKDLTGRKGWYSNSLLGSFGWDSQAGHYGSLKLGEISATWNSEGTTIGLGAGIYIGKDGRVDAVEMGLTIVKVVAAILTYGASTAAEVGATIAVDVAMDVAAEFASQVARMASFKAPQGPNTKGYWKYSSDKDKKFGYTNYWYWLDQTRIEDMYGTLYLHNAQSQDLASNNGFAKIKFNIGGTDQPVKQFPKSSQYSNKGAASDINIDLSDDVDYSDNYTPTTLAYDNFYVNGPGISGGIKPYRLEVGSVSVPREMTSSHIRLNPIPFQDYGTSKVPFMYEGALDNRYYHHVGGATSVSTPSYYFGLNTVAEGNATWGTVNTNALRYDLNDVVFKNERIRTDVSSLKKLPQGNYVDWLSNGEINATTGKFTGSAYMDYFPPSTRKTFRTSYQFGGRNTYYGTSATPNTSTNTSTIQLATGQNVSSIKANFVVDVAVVTEYKDSEGRIVYSYSTTYPNVLVSSVSSSQIVVNSSAISISSTAGHVEIISKSEPKPDGMIGGFVITSADGMNYHYTIPVYDYDFSAKSTDKTDANKYSTLSRSGQFANTWLLTAITGPDFVDRGGATGDGDGYIDSNDWGYWVKFNYGSQSVDYLWRFPYQGTRLDSQDKYNSYSQGLKEKYYLNSVESRSHVALFLKGTRKDAKDASSSKKPSLRLCEIALLTRDAYTQLTNPAGTYKLDNCSGTKDVLYQYTGSTVNKNITTAQEQFIQSNSLRRVVFNGGKTVLANDYSLCQGALNSDAGSGKLTLNSISVLGRNNAKVLPDYKFSYANNPNYDTDKWDGWGMYSSTGTSAGTSHKVSANVSNTDAMAWSLTSIKSPLGHVVDIGYERDTYASISGNEIYSTMYSVNTTSITDYRAGKIYVGSTSSFKVGDYVKLTGHIDFKCSSTQTTPMGSDYDTYCNITNIGTDGYITVNIPNYGSIVCFSSTELSIVSNSGSLRRVGKQGGNLRVGSITLSDNWGPKYKTRYLYEENGLSSGVVSVEPDYIRSSDYAYNFYKWLNYPSTPVMYGKVAVLTGKLTDDTDYSSKQVYQFETPVSSLYTGSTPIKLKEKEQVSAFCYVACIDPTTCGCYTVTDKVSLVKFEIANRMGRVGKLKSMSTYDKSNNLYSSQSYIYGETVLNDGTNNYQGFFTEGTLLNEFTVAGSMGTSVRYHKGQRTTVINYPYVLQKVITTVDGQISESSTTNWDLYTGAVLEQQNKSPLGLRTKTIFEPLYKVSAPGYSELGSKAVNSANKNMLSQIAAMYTFRIDDNGNELGLIDASATTWKKDLSNYRVLQAGNYVNGYDDLDNNGTVSAQEIATQQVWRKYETYSWLGDYSRLNSFGLRNFSSSDKFNFSTTNPTWKKTGSFERFNHYTHILETKDVNGLYSSAKYTSNDRFPLASAVNAKFEEIAFSGAEDPLDVNGYLGSEVALKNSTGNAQVVYKASGSPVHTGGAAISLSTGYGFVYKNSYSTSTNNPGISPNKKYRASVWANSTNGRIYYKINGVEGTPSKQTISQAVKLAGVNWYRHDVVIDIGSLAIPSSFEVGVKSLSGVVIFDDFRFQPFESIMTCNVYNPSTYNLEYTLNNDNVYVRYEYDDKGVLIKTYQETMKVDQVGQNGERLVLETKDDYRRFHIDQ